MNSELVLVRVALPSTPPTPSKPSSCSSPLHFCDNTAFTGVAQWDQNQELCLAVLRAGGLLVTYTLDTGEGGIAPQLIPSSAFQIYISYGKGQDSDLELKAVNVQWGSFEFIPGRSNEILFYQVHSSRILFAQLPGTPPTQVQHARGPSKRSVADKERARVFCVGRHPAFIVCMSVRSDGLAMASAGTDGSIRIWRLSDGAMLCETTVATAHLGQPFGCGPIRGHEAQTVCGLCSGTVQASWSSSRILEFVGKSWEIGMGCKDGKLRLWAMRGAHGDADNVPTDLPLKKSKTLLVAKKIAISAFAVHSPQSGENLFQNAFGSPIDQQATDTTAALSMMQSAEYMAVGTCKGGVGVWVRYSSTQKWVCSWKGDCGDVPVVCLSFRADGGLLAAGTSNMSNWSDGTASQEVGLSERVYLYETTNWRCVGSLTFKSWLGCCLFYRPAVGLGKNLGKEITAACRVLLVCTSDGLQAHILPDLACTDESPKRNGAKTVHWADTQNDVRVENLGSGEVPQQNPERQPEFHENVLNSSEAIHNKRGSSVKLSTNAAEEPSRLLGGNFKDNLRKDNTSKYGAQIVTSSCKEEMSQVCPLHPDLGNPKKKQRSSKDSPQCPVCGGSKVESKGKPHSSWDEHQICQICCHPMKDHGSLEGRNLASKPQEATTGGLDEYLNKCQVSQHSTQQHNLNYNIDDCDNCPLHPKKTCDQKERSTQKEDEEKCEVCHHPKKDHVQKVPVADHIEDEGQCYLHPNKPPPQNEQRKEFKEQCYARDEPKTSNTGNVQSWQGAGLHERCHLHPLSDAKNENHVQFHVEGNLRDKGQQHCLVCGGVVERGFQDVQSRAEDWGGCYLHPSNLPPQKDQNKADQERSRVCRGLMDGHAQNRQDQDNCILHSSLPAHPSSLNMTASGPCEVCGGLLDVPFEKVQASQRGEDPNFCPLHHNLEEEPGSHIKDSDSCKDCHHPLSDHNLPMQKSTGTKQMEVCYLHPENGHSQKQEIGGSKTSPCGHEVRHQALHPPTLEHNHTISISQEANVDVRCNIHSHAPQASSSSNKEELCQTCQHPMKEHSSKKQFVSQTEVDAVKCPLHPSIKPRSEKEQSRHDDPGLKCFTCDHLLIEHSLKEHLHEEAPATCYLHPNSGMRKTTPSQDRGQGNSCTLPKHDQHQERCPLHGADGHIPKAQSAMNLRDSTKCQMCGHPEAVHVSKEGACDRSQRPGQPTRECAEIRHSCHGLHGFEECQICHHPTKDHAQTTVKQPSQGEVATRANDSLACHIHGDINRASKESSSDTCPRCLLPTREREEVLDKCPICDHPKKDHMHMEQPGKRKQVHTELLSHKEPWRSCIETEEYCQTCHHPLKDHVSDFPSSNLREQNNADIHEECHMHKLSDTGIGRILFEEGASGANLRPDPSGHWLERVVASGRIPSHIVQEYLDGRRKWPPQVKKQQCVSCARKVERAPWSVPHEIGCKTESWASRSPAVDKNAVEQKRPPFCTGQCRGKGEEMKPCRNAMARNLFTKPVIKLSNDRTLGVWNRKANKVCGECRNPSSGRWSSILDEMSRYADEVRGDSPVRKKAPMRTPHGAASYGAGNTTGECLQDSTNLQNPELFSTVRLLAKVHKVHNEMFDRCKAFQVAKAKGIALGMEDDLPPKRNARPEKVPVAVEPRATRKNGNKCDRQQKYTDLCKIVEPPIPSCQQQSAPRRVRVQVDDDWVAMQRNRPSISDLWVATDFCPEVCSMLPLNGSPIHWKNSVHSEDGKIWAQREEACREAENMQAVYDSCRL